MADFNMNDYWENQGQIPTLADVEDGLEAGAGVGLTISNIDRDDMGDDASLITINTGAPGAAANGEAWVDTSTLAGAPEIRPRIFNNASSEWLGWNIYYSATEPSTTTTGWLWYDMTTKLLRVYRAAAYDPAGVTGWHPVSEQYQLWKNKTGGIIGPNRAVVQHSTERGFTTTTIGKDATVVGVTLATISSDAYGVMATVAGGAYVDILCNVTPGTIAVGHGIATYTVAGESRSVGALTANPNATAGVQEQGLPLGCFAVAQEAVTTATITACRLLGQVGQGRTRIFDGVVVAHGTTGFTEALWNNTFREIDLASPPVGSDPVTAIHKPISSVLLNVRLLWVGAAAGDSLTLSFSPDQSAITHVMGGPLVANNGDNQTANWPMIRVPTTAGTPFTSLGEKFSWKGQQTGSNPAVSTSTTAQALIVAGYVY